MPRFKGGASGLNPLTVQLVAGASTAEVVAWEANVDTDAGIATVISRPVISRPSLLGTPAGSPQPTIVGVSNPAAVSASALLSAFGTPPSLPGVAPYTTLGGFSVQWAANGPGTGFVILPGSGLLLYALGGAWSGMLEWNEA